jgi:hypothetical protein
VTSFPSSHHDTSATALVAQTPESSTEADRSGLHCSRSAPSTGEIIALNCRLFSPFEPRAPRDAAVVDVVIDALSSPYSTSVAQKAKKTILFVLKIVDYEENPAGLESRKLLAATPMVGSSFQKIKSCIFHLMRTLNEIGNFLSFGAACLILPTFTVNNVRIMSILFYFLSFTILKEIRRCFLYLYLLNVRF